MTSSELLQKPLISATLGDFVEALKTNTPAVEKKQKNLVKGINGLAAACSVSPPTIQTWKNKGFLNGCYSQTGRSILFDLDLVFDALKSRK